MKGVAVATDKYRTAKVRIASPFEASAKLVDRNHPHQNEESLHELNQGGHLVPTEQSAKRRVAVQAHTGSPTNPHQSSLREPPIGRDQRLPDVRSQVCKGQKCRLCVGW